MGMSWEEIYESVKKEGLKYEVIDEEALLEREKRDKSKPTEPVMPECCGSGRGWDG